MLQLYALCQETPERVMQIYFTESHLTHLLEGLKSPKKIVQKRVLKCIYWALIQSEYKITLSQSHLDQLFGFVEGVISANH